MNRVLHNACSVLFAFVLAFTGVALPTSAAVANDGDGDAASETAAETDGILITLEAEASASLLSADEDGASDVESELADAGLEVTGELTGIDGEALVTADVAGDQSVDEAVAAAENVDGVAQAQPNYVYQLIGNVESTETDLLSATSDMLGTSDIMGLLATSLVNDPYAQVSDVSITPNQYWLYNASIVEAWDDAQANGSVTVATLDTGAYVGHEDLAVNVLTEYAYDAYSRTQLTDDTNTTGTTRGHGTHVAGIIAGVANNDTGIAGGSYNANIIPVSVYGTNSRGTYTATTASVVAGYAYLLDLVESDQVDDLRVVNMSIGAYGSTLDDTALHEAIATARNDYGIVTVCAGGNGNGSTTAYTENIYPADFDECVAVTALKADGTNAVWSDYNDAKDISAPGVGIYSTKYRASSDTSDSYTSMSGTSQASPLVSSVFALMFAAVPDATVDEACEALYATATAITDTENDHSATSGSHGAVDAAAAVEYLEAKSQLKALLATATETQSANAKIASAEDAFAAAISTAQAVYDDESTTAEAAASATSTLQAAMDAYLASTDSFSDVTNTSDWYYDVVYWTLENGIMNGYGNGAFGPNDTLTREMAAGVFYNYLGDGAVSEAAPHTDVSQSAWYTNPVNWAVASGAMYGYSSTIFGVGDPLTREQAVSIIANVAVLTGTATQDDIDGTDTSALENFADGDSVSTYAQQNLAWAVANGVMNGADNGDGTRSINASDTVTRAEMAALISNAIESGVL